MQDHLVTMVTQAKHIKTTTTTRWNIMIQDALRPNDQSTGMKATFVLQASYVNKKM